MGWERARTDTQKARRIAEILDATARLYATQPFENKTLVPIARAAKFSNMQLAASIGVHRMTNLSAVQKEVLAFPEFKHLKADYPSFYQECIEHLLKGLLS